jgi:hypothetical protein
MRVHSIDDVIGLNSMALLAASIVAQPVEGSRKQPSTEILRAQSAHKTARPISRHQRPPHHRPRY